MVKTQQVTSSTFTSGVCRERHARKEVVGLEQVTGEAERLLQE